MKRMLMGLCLGTVILSGSMMGSGTEQQPVTQETALQELGLRPVAEANIAKGKADVESSIRFFNAVRYACGAALLGVVGYTLYNGYVGMKSRSSDARFDALEADMKRVLKQAPGETEQKNWTDSICSFGKSIFTGLPTQVATSIVSGATLGFMSAKLPMSEFAKSEPSFGWFLTHKTGFASGCGLLIIYYQQQAVHDAFCVETTRLVGDVEKILGYVDYQISQIKKSSSMAAKVLASRRAQLVGMTNKLVDLVAQKQYEEMVGAVQLLNGFVHEGLTAGILE